MGDRSSSPKKQKKPRHLVAIADSRRQSTDTSSSPTRGRSRSRSRRGTPITATETQTSHPSVPPATVRPSIVSRGRSRTPVNRDRTDLRIQGQELSVPGPRTTRFRERRGLATSNTSGSTFSNVIRADEFPAVKGQLRVDGQGLQLPSQKDKPSDSTKTSSQVIRANEFPSLPGQQLRVDGQGIQLPSQKEAEGETVNPKWNKVKSKIKKKQTSDKLEDYQKKQTLIRQKIKDFKAIEASGILNQKNEVAHKNLMKEIQKLAFEAEGDLSKIKKELETENDQEGLEALNDLTREEGVAEIAADIEILATESKIGKKKRHKKLSEVLEPESKQRLERDLERLQIILKAKKKKKLKQEDDEGYNRWLSERGFDPNTSEKQVLASYGYNWFKLKDDLAFKKGKKESSAEYSIKLAAMNKILKFRKKEVDSILENTRKAIAEKYGIPVASIEAGAFGSITPTSDYDITFSILGNPELETDCVEHFNKTFKKEFGVSSGVLFDTNVYTNGFMTEGFDKDFNETDYIDQFNPLKKKTSDLSEAEQKTIQEGEKAKDQTQMALSYVAIRQALDKDNWDAFKQKATNEITTNQKLNGENKNAAIRDLNEIFQKAESLHQETDSAVATMKSSKEIKDNLTNVKAKDFDQHAEAESKDKLYVKSLRNASQKMMRIEAIRKKLQQDEDAPDRAEMLTELKNNIIDFEMEQGKALIYANEAYFSGGAAVHVVKGMQGGAGVELSPQQRMQSLIMNIGYKVNHFNHQEKDGLGKAHLNTSKYGQRIAHGLVNGAGGDLTNDLSTDAQKLLRLDKQLISDVKKNDIQLQTPSKKEAEAADVMKGLNGQNIKDAYLEIAAKSVANLYAVR